MTGLASPSFLVVVTTSSVGRNNSPFFWKNGPPPASMIEWNRPFWSDSFAISAVVACDASSEVGASMTARVVSSLGGKNLSNCASRWRQGSSLEMSLLTSASMAKCLTA